MKKWQAGRQTDRWTDRETRTSGLTSVTEKSGISASLLYTVSQGSGITTYSRTRRCIWMTSSGEMSVGCYLKDLNIQGRKLQWASPAWTINICTRMGKRFCHSFELLPHGGGEEGLCNCSMSLRVASLTWMTHGNHRRLPRTSYTIGFFLSPHGMIKPGQLTFIALLTYHF